MCVVKTKKSEEGIAVQNLRRLRNEFVHELHLNPALTLQMFDEKWHSIMDLLTPLAKFGSVQQLLDSEANKILSQAIDAKMQREFADEFNTLHDQIDEVYEYTYTFVHACRLM